MSRKNQGAWPFMALNLPEAARRARRAPAAAGGLPLGLGISSHRLA
jgi:hypothetical protein